MSSRERVPEHTSEKINHQIEAQTKERIDYYSKNPKFIDGRLKELDEEWDIERTLETNSSVISLFGLIMGLRGSPRWFLLPLAVQSFFLQHALQGWCPPLPLLRRYGFRTSEEIERERTALKAIRGDFQQINGKKSGKSEAAWNAASR